MMRSTFLRKPLSSCLVGLMLALIPATLAPAQATPAAQPAAEEVFARFVEATGGKDAYSKINSRLVTGKLNIPAQKLSGPVITYVKSPGLLYVNTTFAGAGQFDQGFDGKVAWEKSDMEGVRILEGDELDRTIQSADPQAELNWKKYYTSATNVGQADVNGKNCFKIDLVTKSGKTESRFYEVDGGLLVRSDIDLDTSRGNVKVSAYTRDWRDAGGGVKLPFATTQKVALGSINVEYEIAVERSEVNVDIPEDKFKLPAEVAELVKQQAGQTGKPGGK